LQEFLQESRSSGRFRKVLEGQEVLQEFIYSGKQEFYNT
jgi:hypothetical protein